MLVASAGVFVVWLLGVSVRPAAALVRLGLGDLSGAEGGDSFRCRFWGSDAVCCSCEADVRCFLGL